MKTKISGSTGFSENLLVEKILIICGIISPMLFIGTDILAGTIWVGYSFVSRSISELSAIGAPTRLLVLTLDIINDLLMIAFGFGVWGLAGQKYALRVTACLLIGYVLSLVGTFFPMHLGEIVSAYANTMNVILMGVSVLSILIAIGSGAAAYRNWFRFYSIGTLLVFIVLAILGLLVVPRIATDHTASRIGIQERIMIYGCFLWIVMLAILLLRTEKRQESD